MIDSSQSLENAPPPIRDVLIELLSLFGDNREAREYLRRFSKVDEHQFAVIKVGGSVLKDDLEALASALVFLRLVGLAPIILHGAGVQIDQALKAEGVTSRKIDGLRVTTDEVLAIARRVVHEESLRLEAALARKGVGATICETGVFQAKPFRPETYGRVGEVTGVDPRPVRVAVAAGSLPIIPPFGLTAGGEVLNINADHSMRALVQAIQPYKVVFLTPSGGLLDKEGRILSTINLATDFGHLMSAGWVHSGMRLKLEEIKQILDHLPGSASVSITSASHLTRELFTHRGAGTIIRKGERLEKLGDLDQAATVEIRQIMEACFGKKLRPDYFEGKDFSGVFWPTSHRAAALVVEGVGDCAYLDKFAVLPEARGEGLANALFDEVCSRFPALYWRSRSNNPINSWYFQQAEAVWRTPEWIVFGRGISDDGIWRTCRDDALGRADSWDQEADHA